MRLLCAAVTNDIDFIRANADFGGMIADRVSLERSRASVSAALPGAPKPAEVSRQIGCHTAVWLLLALMANLMFTVPN